MVIHRSLVAVKLGLKLPLVSGDFVEMLLQQRQLSHRVFRGCNGGENLVVVQKPISL
jgi:hypothetical protein